MWVSRDAFFVCLYWFQMCVFPGRSLWFILWDFVFYVSSFVLPVSHFGKPSNRDATGFIIGRQIASLTLPTMHCLRQLWAGGLLSWMWFLIFFSRAFGQQDSHSFQSNHFFCQRKYSLLHRLLASADVWWGRSLKLMFFPFCTSCCGWNLTVQSWTDHLSDRFLMSFPHFPVKGRPPCVWPSPKLVLQCFCNLLSLCLVLLAFYLLLLVSRSDLTLMCQALVKNLYGTFPLLWSKYSIVKHGKIRENKMLSCYKLLKKASFVCFATC